MARVRSSLRVASPDNLPDAELLVREGIGAAEVGDHARARELLSLALTLDEGHVGGWMWLSSEVGAREHRAFCLRRVLALEPDNGFARQGLAWLSGGVEGPIDRALLLRRLADGVASPDHLSDADLLVREGIKAVEAANHVRARDLLSLGLTLDQDHVQGWLWLSGEVETLEDKAFCLHRALDLEPDNKLARQRLALLGGEVEGPKDRPLHLRRMPDTAAGPDDLSDAELLVREGIEAAEAGSHARARDLLSLGLTLDEGLVQGWMWLSSEVEHSEDKAFCLRRVLALEPGNEFAQRGLAWIREQRKLRVQALLEKQRLMREQVSLQVQRQPQEQRMVHDLREAVGVGDILDTAETGDVLDAEEVGERPAETVIEPVAEASREEQVRPIRTRPIGAVGIILRSEFVFIVVPGLLLLGFIATGMEGLPASLSLLLLLMGLAFASFAPGYALQAALFPRKDALRGPQRLALSIGLSVAFLPALVLLANWLSWGIHLQPIAISEGLVTIVLSGAALVRRARLPAEARPALVISLDLKTWWVDQDRRSRVLYRVLAGALLLAMVTVSAIILIPKPGERFTEFYILGSEELAESYPREAAPGELMPVIAGITNREGQAAEYRIEVWVEGEPIGVVGPVTLGDGEVWEGPVAYALPQAGDAKLVEFQLYRAGAQEPYHHLRMWINVVAGPGDEDE